MSTQTTSVSATFHVVPFGDWWAVVSEGPRIVSVHDVKHDAISAGTAHARQSGAELVVHNRGAISRFDSVQQAI